MKKIAIINQRYGLEVNGGSECYARLMAEHLKKHYDVEVLTTTALDYDTWKDHYSEGVEYVNGIKVRRFAVEHPRKVLKFRIINQLTKMLGRIGIHQMERYWIKEQGPQVPELVRYIKEHVDEYDRFVFVTYLYYTTAMGLPEVFDKAVLIPTAHDEPCIYFSYYEKIFKSPSGMVFLTEEEKEFVQKTFRNASIPNDVVGVGIDIPDNLQKEKGRLKAVEEFRQKYHIIDDYIIYAGRIDRCKKCDEMFIFFEKYKELHKDDKTKLVIIGKDMMGVPNHPDICYLGFVSEEDKYAGIAGAKLLWLPSQFESLSIALLEGMALGIPGIVNGNCEVLKGHCIRSNGAVWYTNFEEYEVAMCRLRKMPEEVYNQMRQSAMSYVEKDYQWDVVEQKLTNMIG